MIRFDRTPEFEKDLKKLSKKWRSLPNDIELAKKVITVLYEPQKEISLDGLRQQFFSSNKNTILEESETYEVVKMRLRCKDLRTDAVTRITFIWIKTDSKVLLIELFSKNDKAREDIYRIAKYKR